MSCDHRVEQCSCICHEPYKLIIHDHACCSPCFTCGFREKCNCKFCSPQKPSNDGEKHELRSIHQFHSI